MSDEKKANNNEKKAISDEEKAKNNEEKSVSTYICN